MACEEGRSQAGGSLRERIASSYIPAIVNEDVLTQCIRAQVVVTCERIEVLSVYARVARNVLWLLALLLASTAEHLVKESKLRRSSGEERRKDDQDSSVCPHFSRVQVPAFSEYNESVRSSRRKRVGLRCCYSKSAASVVVLKHCWQLSNAPGIT